MTDTEIVVHQGAQLNATFARKSIISEILPGVLLGGCRWTGSGLYVPASISWEDWSANGTALLSIQRAIEEAGNDISWAIGDWLLAGERWFGDHDKWAQAVEITGKSEQRLMGLQWVAERIPPERRRLELSFRSHAAVAVLEPDEQDEILDMAVRDGLNSDEVRRVKRALQGKDRSRKEAEWATDRATDYLRHTPPRLWTTVIMVKLIKPLRDLTDAGSYREFLRELAYRINRWIDLN